jgi:signal transduction protein with GAF and PtsI domain
VDGGFREEGGLVQRIHSFDEAARSLLQKVGEDLAWDIGCVWKLDPAAKVLRFVLSWHKPGAPTSELEKLSATVVFSPGVGLPGRVFASGEPAWISDVQTDLSFPRVSAAAEEGIRGGFGVPILAGRRVVGVIEFFSRHVRERDDKLLRTVTSMGSELGPLLTLEVDAGGEADEGIDQV